MYAIVDIKGFQYKLEKGERLHVPRYDVEVGEKISIPDVLLVADGDAVSVGTPFVEGAVVKATVAAHDKDKKIIVFKKKRRNDYSVKRGHRQEYTEIVIDDIRIVKPRKAKKTAVKTDAPVEKQAEEPLAVQVQEEPLAVQAQEEPVAQPAGEKRTRSTKSQPAKRKKVHDDNTVEGSQNE